MKSMPEKRGLQPFVIKKIFHIPALKEPNFRRYIIGQGIWIPGAWMFMSSIKYLTYELTGSYEALGILGFFMALPFLLLSPFATSISDVFTRRKTVLYFQAIRISVYPVLAFLVWMDMLTFPLLVLFACIESSAVAMQFPSKLTLLMDLVGPEKMVSAGGFSTVVMNIGRIIGPMVAGWFLSFGPAWAFITAFCLSIPLLVILMTLKTTQVREVHSGNILNQFAKGARYVFKRPRPVLILIIISTSAILGYGVQILLPGIAKEILHLGPFGYGMLESSIGVGALFAALLLATKAGFGIPVKIFSITAIVLPIVGLFMAYALGLASFPLAVVAFAMFGFTIANQNSLGRSILPLLVHRRFAGRVMGFFSIAMIGSKPFGNLLVGFLASVMAVPWAFLILYGTLLGAGSISGLKLFSIARRSKEP